MRIGLFDFGIGGLTVLHQALRLLPHEDYIYYADVLVHSIGGVTAEMIIYRTKPNGIVAELGLQIMKEGPANPNVSPL